MRETEKRFLPRMLSESDVRDRAERLAKILIERAEVEAKRKGAMAHYKSVIDEAEARAAKLAHEVGEGIEWEYVECRWTADGKEALLIREDTGEVGEARALRPEERQTTLFVDAGVGGHA